MSIQCCRSCGQFVLPWEELWAVVDPERPRPAEWLCENCERVYEIESQVFVFTDHRRHVATLLSDIGLRLAKSEALQKQAA